VITLSQRCLCFFFFFFFPVSPPLSTLFEPSNHFFAPKSLTTDVPPRLPLGVGPPLISCKCAFSPLPTTCLFHHLLLVFLSPRRCDTWFFVHFPISPVYLRLFGLYVFLQSLQVCDLLLRTFSACWAFEDPSVSTGRLKPYPFLFSLYLHTSLFLFVFCFSYIPFNRIAIGPPFPLFLFPPLAPTMLMPCRCYFQRIRI